MANRRMISKNILYSDEFFDMPSEYLRLYIYLILEADDDGFVDNVKHTLRSLGLREEAMEYLKEKELIIEFRSGICAVTHWHKHNSIDRPGYRPTEHVEKNLIYVEDGIYFKNFD